MRKSRKAENKSSDPPSNQSVGPLPVASLRLLAPPLRLVSAALWKVMQQRDVLHYGKLEEFVSSISQTVPGLLSYRHQAKLTVGLRARLILEMVRVSQCPDPELILPQLERLQSPTLPNSKRKDQKVETAVKNFHTLVHTLLSNPAGRNTFFQEEFDSQYGLQFEVALEKLLWEFLTRLDQLLPVPDLAQTVSWLCAAPAVLEECARSVSQPQLLRTLLQHEQCLGHLDSAASIPSSIGDSILSSLSLPPSGRVQETNHPESTHAPSHNRMSRPEQSTQESKSKQTRGIISQITPVIGSISSKDLPQRTSADQYIVSDLKSNSKEAITEVSSHPKVRSRSCSKSNEMFDNIMEEHLPRKMLATEVSGKPSREVEKKDEVVIKTVKRSKRNSNVTGKRETRSSTRVSDGERKRQGEDPQYISETSKKRPQDINSQKEEGLSEVLASCMKHELRVIIPKLDIRDQNVLLKTAATDKLESNFSVSTAIEGVFRVINEDSFNRKRKLCDASMPQKNLTDTVDGQMYDGSPYILPVMPLRIESSEKASPVSGDVIVDSEDEAAENVKGRLFTKRYCRTKNNTYIPTLYEYWSPAFARRDLVSPGNGCR